jgi:hypothetical protein
MCVDIFLSNIDLLIKYMHQTSFWYPSVIALKHSKIRTLKNIALFVVFVVDVV